MFFPFLIGTFVLMGFFLLTQSRFYSAYEQWRRDWTPRAERTFISRRDIRAMLGATFRKADEPVVERARRIYVLAIAIWVAWIFAGPVVLLLT